MSISNPRKPTKSMRLTFTYIIFRTNIINLSSYMAGNIRLEGEKNGKYAEHTFENGRP